MTKADQSSSRFQRNMAWQARLRSGLPHRSIDVEAGRALPAGSSWGVKGTIMQKGILFLLHGEKT